MIKIKRIYENPAQNDGFRFLVDRLWPRGLTREASKIDDWLKNVAPSQPLRVWFGHDPAKWDEFCRRYTAELDGKPETWLPILEAARRGNVTLLYSARDTEHNSALILMGYLKKSLAITKP